MKTTFTIHKFDDLDVDTLRHLYTLTNVSGHDMEDNGGCAGSMFQTHLDARMVGTDYPDTWVVLGHAGEQVIAWCMVTNHHVTVTASMGFYVKRPYRRQGVGTRLMQEARAVARKFGAAAIEVNPWNHTSRSFFQSQGFESVHFSCVRQRLDVDQHAAAP